MPPWPNGKGSGFRNQAQPGSRDVRLQIATGHMKRAREDSNLRPPV